MASVNNIEFWKQQEVIWDAYKAFIGRTQLEPSLEGYRAFSGGYRASCEATRPSLTISDRVIGAFDVDDPYHPGCTVLGHIVGFPDPDHTYIKEEWNGFTWLFANDRVSKA